MWLREPICNGYILQASGRLFGPWINRSFEALQFSPLTNMSKALSLTFQLGPWPRRDRNLLPLTQEKSAYLKLGKIPLGFFTLKSTDSVGTLKYKNPLYRHNIMQIHA